MAFTLYLIGVCLKPLILDFQRTHTVFVRAANENDSLLSCVPVPLRCFLGLCAQFYLDWMVVRVYLVDKCVWSTALL